MKHADVAQRGLQDHNQIDRRMARDASVLTVQNQLINEHQDRANLSDRHQSLTSVAQRMASSLQTAQLRQKTAQLQLLGGSGVVQRTDVEEEADNATDTLTADKKIKTRNYGTGWYRFEKDGLQINSFSTNLTKKSPVGTSPTSEEIELSDDAKVNEYDIETLSRAQHFGAGDRLAGTSPNYRKGKWTWHHRIQPYEMELVDMGVHRSFGHHGGFSAWQEGKDDDNDD